MCGWSHTVARTRCGQVRRCHPLAARAEASATPPCRAPRPQLYSWGDNTHGQCGRPAGGGDGDAAPPSVEAGTGRRRRHASSAMAPGAIVLASAADRAVTAASVSCGWSHCIALVDAAPAPTAEHASPTRALLVWGRNNFGQLGACIGACALECACVPADLSASASSHAPQALARRQTRLCRHIGTPACRSTRWRSLSSLAAVRALSLVRALLRGSACWAPRPPPAAALPVSRCPSTTQRARPAMPVTL